MNKAFLVAGLSYGDEGKGAAVDYLCRKHNARLVVRYNGGCQAAHTVVHPDGRYHIFSQFGSGSFLPNVHTHLSRFMMVNPATMLHEHEVLSKLLHEEDIFKRVTVDKRCLITTGLHVSMNRIREEVRKRKHGSCGMGVGETRSYHISYGADAIFAGDLEDMLTVEEKVKKMLARFKVMACQLGQPGTFEYPEWVASVMNRLTEWKDRVTLVNKLVLGKDPVVFEGAHGIMLDERDEFAPHNTWTNTTFDNADALLAEALFDGDVVRIGCLRTYATRHGLGPLPTEDIKLYKLPELHNTDTGYQGHFRRGHFNQTEVRHALDICGGVDQIHMSHCDYLPHIYPDCIVDRHVDNIERLLETPITVLGYGPTHAQRKERHVKSTAARRGNTDTSTGVSRTTAQQAGV